MHIIFPIIEDIIYWPIGIIHTSLFWNAVFSQSTLSEEMGAVEVFDTHARGYENIEQHTPIVLIFYIHRSGATPSLTFEILATAL